MHDGIADELDGRTDGHVNEMLNLRAYINIAHAHSPALTRALALIQ